MPSDKTMTSAPVVSLDDLLARAGARDRTNIQKHMALCDAEADTGHAKLWRRLASKFAALAPHMVQGIGQQAIAFFIADGKYRLQVFALEDNRDGLLHVFLPDVLSQAIREKLVTKSGDGYVIPGAAKQKLPIALIDTSNTSQPAPHTKHMIGWNRKAMQITLSTSEPDSPLVDAAEAVCTLAATHFVRP